MPRKPKPPRKPAERPPIHPRDWPFVDPDDPDGWRESRSWPVSMAGKVH